MEETLQPLPGVANVKVDVGNKMVVCTVTEKFDADKALTAVRGAATGFASAEIVN